MNAHEIEGPSVEAIGDQLADQREERTEEADREIREVRVSMRWLEPQGDVVKRAADRYGIPYQTCIKQAAFRRRSCRLQRA
jgi:predicted DNA binding CopG/RHH family protein